MCRSPRPRDLLRRWRGGGARPPRRNASRSSSRRTQMNRRPVGDVGDLQEGRERLVRIAFDVHVLGDASPAQTQFVRRPRQSAQGARRLSCTTVGASSQPAMEPSQARTRTGIGAPTTRSIRALRASAVSAGDLCSGHLSPWWRNVRDSQQLVASSPIEGILEPCALAGVDPRIAGPAPPGSGPPADAPCDAPPVPADALERELGILLRRARAFSAQLAGDVHPQLGPPRTVSGSPTWGCPGGRQANGLLSGRGAATVGAGGTDALSGRCEGADPAAHDRRCGPGRVGACRLS